MVMDYGFSRLNPGRDVLTLVKTTFLTCTLGVALGLALAVWWGLRSNFDQLTFGIFAVLFSAVLGAVVGAVSGFAALLVARRIVARGPRVARAGHDDLAHPSNNTENASGVQPALLLSSRAAVAAAFASAGLVLLLLLSINTLGLTTLVGLLIAAFVLYVVGHVYVAPRMLSSE